jgi:hypothetical protein
MMDERSQRKHLENEYLSMIKSRRMRWAGNIARMGRREMRIGYWGGRQEERDN